MKRRFSALLLASGLCLAACGSRSAPQSGDGGADQRVAPSDTSLRRDVLPDTGCECPADRVLTVGACVPTRELYACVAPCDPTHPNSCPASSPFQLCDQWAASTSCTSAQALPACVPGPAMSFPPGTLRIAPTSGNAADEVTVQIEGGSFYVGALMWYGRVAGGKPIFLDGAEGGPCRAKLTFTPPGPGLHPIEVTYGDGSNDHSWLLAGFYLASGGAIDPPRAQPGLRCSSALPCAMAAPYVCSCQKGRCACNVNP